MSFTEGDAFYVEEGEGLPAGLELDDEGFSGRAVGEDEDDEEERLLRCVRAQPASPPTRLLSPSFELMPAWNVSRAAREETKLLEAQLAALEGGGEEPMIDDTEWADASAFMAGLEEQVASDIEAANLHVAEELGSA